MKPNRTHFKTGLHWWYAHRRWKARRAKQKPVEPEEPIEPEEPEGATHVDWIALTETYPQVASTDLITDSGTYAVKVMPLAGADRTGSAWGSAYRGDFAGAIIHGLPSAAAWDALLAEESTVIIEVAAVGAVGIINGLNRNGLNVPGYSNVQEPLVHYSVPSLGWWNYEEETAYRSTPNSVTEGVAWEIE